MTSRSVRVPLPGFGRPSRRPHRVLLLCFYDPAGIATVLETIAWMQAASQFSVTVLNLHEHRLDEGVLKLHPWVNLRAFDAIVVHNTLSYSIDNLRSLDERLACRLRDYDGVKVLMKQDENYRFRELARWIGETRFDILFTCLPPEAVPLVYPPDVVGPLRVERMLTGYVTPTLRARRPEPGARPIDIGYRGSIQPLSFGRLAFEKRTIGEDVAARLAGRGLALDISSRWEDRLGGDAWLDFLSACKATLGAESGASIFDLDGDLDARVDALQKRYAGIAGERERAEAVLGGLADLEGNVRYHQVSPRHLEAAACGTLQLLFPGDYSGILQPWRHYIPLERDFSNLDAAMEVVLDDSRRLAITRAAHEELVVRPDHWIEGFVQRLDACISEAFERRPPPGGVRVPAGAHMLLVGCASTLPAAPAGPGPTVHELVPGPQTARVAPEGGAGLRVTVAPGPALRIPPPWEDDAGAAALLEAQALLDLGEPALCARVGAPAGDRSVGMFRRELQEWAATAQALREGVTRCEGARLVVSTDLAGLVAALALRARGTRVMHAPAAAAPRASPEWMRCYWRALEDRLAAEADEVRAPATGQPWSPPALADGERQEPFTWLGPPQPFLVPRRSTFWERPAQAPRRLAYAALRTAWRLLPAALQTSAKPFARRLMTRWF